MNPTTPMKAIRLKCLDCCCFSANEVKLCEIDNCPLHEFRFGKSPYRKKPDLSDEQRKQLAENMRRVNSMKNQNTNSAES